MESAEANPFRYSLKEISYCRSVKSDCKTIHPYTDLHKATTLFIILNEPKQNEETFHLVKAITYFQSCLIPELSESIGCP